jgi:Leucine-rich repeat (LRR) protein
VVNKSVQSHNRITNGSMEIISQIPTLRDLKLNGNLFYGPLEPSFTKLVNLEVADLHGNNLTGLPLNMENMVKLRCLNISDNNFESILFEPLARLPLTELLARKNKLRGVLIESAVTSLATLQVLDISSNQITHLVESGSSIELPALHQLVLSTNRLQELPSVTNWPGLVTLAADENNINSIPEGFTGLENLRHADFSSNDIQTLPPEIGRMENLAMLRLSGNPLRDKKFSNATTDELKAVLAGRLPPIEVPQPAETQQDSTSSAMRRDSVGQDDHSEDDFATPPTSVPHSPARSRSHTASSQAWPVKSGGVLDRSGTESSSLNPVTCSRIAAEQTVREVYLQRNLFASLPESLSFFADSLTTLSLANNQLVGETYFGSTTDEGLGLPSLKELNLSTNHITSLVPLITHLRAPALQKLDVSFNRLSSLPPGAALREAFPNLQVLLLSNNHLPDLDPESIKGCRIVDVMNNDIGHLDPRIGLLGGAGGLERLEITGNRFRVPRFNVIERGTEATLRWLRGRVPVAEMGAWREANAQGGGGADFDDVD